MPTFDELLDRFRRNCAEAGCDPVEIEEAASILEELRGWPAAKLRQLLELHEYVEALEALGDPELVDDFWRRQGVVPERRGENGE